MTHSMSIPERQALRADCAIGPGAGTTTPIADLLSSYVIFPYLIIPAERSMNVAYYRHVSILLSHAVSYNRDIEIGDNDRENMARAINRLSARKVATITKPGRHSDGANLYLSVSESGSRSWVFLFRWRGKIREIGLGPARDVTLARARELAAERRSQLAEGIEPKGIKSASGAPTFGEVADKVVEAMRPSWRSSKHTKQWQMMLQHYAAPLRRLPVDKITTEDVLGVLKPIWTTKNETASRLRSRIETVLAAGEAQGFRSGKNPATWRNHLDHLLPRGQRVEQKHHAAMPYGEVPTFLERLRAKSSNSALALEFAILTAARTGEVLKARLEEFDLEAGLWSIPAERMKAGREHNVPLSPRAVEIVREASRYEAAPFVFCGRKHGTSLTSSSLELALLRMGVTDATPHGFRSSFRDWAGDCTMFPREIAEAALAHVVGGVEGDYRRGTALEKRRQLMNAWEAYCAAPNVVPFRRVVSA
jgi:integrase